MGAARGGRCRAVIFDIINADLPLLLTCVDIVYVGDVPHLVADVVPPRWCKPCQG